MGTEGGREVLFRGSAEVAPGSPGEAEAGIAEELVGDKGIEDIGAFLEAGIAGVQDRDVVFMHSTILRKSNNRKNTDLKKEKPGPKIRAVLWMFT